MSVADAQREITDPEYGAHMKRNRRVMALLDRWLEEDMAADADPQEALPITPLSLREVEVD